MIKLNLAPILIISFASREVGCVLLRRAYTSYAKMLAWSIEPATSLHGKLLSATVDCWQCSGECDFTANV